MATSRFEYEREAMGEPLSRVLDQPVHVTPVARLVVRSLLFPGLRRRRRGRVGKSTHRLVGEGALRLVGRRSGLNLQRLGKCAAQQLCSLSEEGFALGLLDPARAIALRQAD